MKEKDIQRIWGGYLHIHQPPMPEAHELKITKGPSIRIDAVKPHQVLGLQHAKTGLYYKIQDMAATNGFADPKPFDNFWMIGGSGYVVICFYKLRKPKFVYKIPVDIWIKETEKVTKKSVREEEIRSWQGIEYISLKTK
jgi:hypothetical protein